MPHIVFSGPLGGELRVLDAAGDGIDEGIRHTHTLPRAETVEIDTCHPTSHRILGTDHPKQAGRSGEDETPGASILIDESFDGAGQFGESLNFANNHRAARGDQHPERICASGIQT
ncbi:MAG: hypothetical protein Q4D79_03790 [Propionibacteriaceae bacterium]|nr:hypothetical protein [Propionibacteriaceae bacterium]